MASDPRVGLKDFTLILESAAATGHELPLASVYSELMRSCMAAGQGDWDNSAVIQAIRRAGRQPKR